MADTITIPLGSAPSIGNDAVTQCLFFKTLMRQEIGRDPAGAWLRTLVDNGRCLGMAVEYCPDVPGALQWAKAAQERAELVWEQVVGRQRPHGHITSRSRGCRA